jgi:hypothetical protein
MRRFANISTRNVVVATLVFAAFVAFGFAGPANASVLNVNMLDPTDLPLDPGYTGVGAAPDPGTYWNEMTALSFPSGLLYSDGVTPATGISLLATNQQTTAPIKPGTPAPGDIDLFDSMWQSAVGKTGVLTISGLSTNPNTTYNVYVYSWNVQYRKATSINANGSASWVSSTANNLGGSFVQDANYHEFAGLLAPSGTIAIDYYFTGDCGYLNAFQLVSNTVVPEPSTLALLAAGLAALLCYAWRKRK